MDVLNQFAKALSKDASEESPQSVELDKTQLPRLINMRAQRARLCECQRCVDLLTLLHNSHAFLVHEHQSEQWGLRFWTDALQEKSLPEAKEFNLREHAHALLDCARFQSAVDSLLAAEKNWQSSQNEKCVDDDTDEAWLRHYNTVLEKYRVRDPRTEANAVAVVE